MNDLEKIALERIQELSKEASVSLALLPLKDPNLNFNDHILPISNMLSRIEETAKAIRYNKD
jgi:hypothetical protein